MSDYQRQDDEEVEGRGGEEQPLNPHLNDPPSPIAASPPPFTSLPNMSSPSHPPSYQTFENEIDVEAQDEDVEVIDEKTQRRRQGDLNRFIQSTAAVSPTRSLQPHQHQSQKQSRRERHSWRGEDYQYSPPHPHPQPLRTLSRTLDPPNPKVITYSLHVKNLCGNLVFDSTYCSHFEGRITEEEFRDSMRDISTAFEKHNPKPEAAFLIMLVLFFCVSISAGGIIAPAWALYGALITALLFCCWLPFSISSGRKLRVTLDERMRAQNLQYAGRGIRWQFQARSSDVMPMSIEVVLDPLPSDIPHPAASSIHSHHQQQHYNKRQQHSQKQKQLHTQPPPASFPPPSAENAGGVQNSQDLENAQASQFVARQKRRNRRRAPPPPPIPTLMTQSLSSHSDASSSSEEEDDTDQFIDDYCDDLSSDNPFSTSSSSLSESDYTSSASASPCPSPSLALRAVPLPLPLPPTPVPVALTTTTTTTITTTTITTAANVPPISPAIEPTTPLPPLQSPLPQAHYKV